MTPPGVPDGADRSSGVRGVRHRLRYRFDNLLARGTWAALVWLGVVTVAAVLFSALLLWLAGVSFAGSSDGSWLEDAWQSLLRVMDTGTMAGDVGWGPRVLALLVTVFGLLVAGTLIGVIAAGVEDRIDRMRRGRSVVVESDHVVVLGSSDRLAVVVQQLVLAGDGRTSDTIVVLADRDPSEMNDEVRLALGERRGGRIVFRSGDPTRRSDLAMVRLPVARTVIVLADPTGGDARAVGTALAVGAELGGFDRLPMIVEVMEAATADSLRRACGPDVHPIMASEAVARAAAFALREPGLSQVIAELFDAAGADVHVLDHPDLAGRTFGEIVGRFAKARPIGRFGTDGAVELAPPADTTFAPGDRMVVVADDAGRLEPAAEPSVVPAGGSSGPSGRPLADPPDDEHLLVVGWNDLGARLLGNWARFTSSTSTVEVAVDSRLCGLDEVDVPGLDPHRLTATDTASTAGLVARERDEERMPTSIVLLAYAGRLPAADADSRTLLDLMVLRRELTAEDVQPAVIVELLDTDNLPLAQMPGADDYLVSQAIGSQMIAQLATQPDRRAVYLEMYAGAGPSIHLVDARRLGLAGELAATDVFAAAQRAGLVAIGWRRSPERGGAVTLNPHGATRTVLEPGDELVVVA